MDAWISAVVVVVAVVVVAAFKVFGRDKRKTEILADTEQRVEKLKAAADATLAVELQAVEAERSELEKIQGIDDDDERLAALAGYLQRRVDRK